MWLRKGDNKQSADLRPGSNAWRPNQVDLTVEDDGLGFNPAKLADLAGLEAQGHCGLAGMQERAA